jgi:hypothetical protein
MVFAISLGAAWKLVEFLAILIPGSANYGWLVLTALPIWAAYTALRIAGRRKKLVASGPHPEAAAGGGGIGLILGFICWTVMLCLTPGHSEPLWLIPLFFIMPLGGAALVGKLAAKNRRNVSVPLLLLLPFFVIAAILALCAVIEHSM